MRLFSGWNLQNYTEILELSRQNRFACYSQQIPATKPEADGRDISQVFEAGDPLPCMDGITGLKKCPRMDLQLIKLKVPFIHDLDRIRQSGIVPLNHPIKIDILWL